MIQKNKKILVATSYLNDSMEGPDVGVTYQLTNGAQRDSRLLPVIGKTLRGAANAERPIISVTHNLPSSRTYSEIRRSYRYRLPCSFNSCRSAVSGLLSLRFEIATRTYTYDIQVWISQVGSLNFIRTELNYFNWIPFEMAPQNR